jgi:hypothetical protein
MLLDLHRLTSAFGTRRRHGRERDRIEMKMAGGRVLFGAGGIRLVVGRGTGRAQAHGKHWQGKYPPPRSLLLSLFSSTIVAVIVCRCCRTIRQFSSRRSRITKTKTETATGDRGVVWLLLEIARNSGSSSCGSDGGGGRDSRQLSFKILSG